MDTILMHAFVNKNSFCLFVYGYLIYFIIKLIKIVFSRLICLINLSLSTCAGLFCMC